MTPTGVHTQSTELENTNPSFLGDQNICYQVRNFFDYPMRARLFVCVYTGTMKLWFQAPGQVNKHK